MSALLPRDYYGWCDYDAFTNWDYSTSTRRGVTTSALMLKMAMMGQLIGTRISPVITTRPTASILTWVRGSNGVAVSTSDNWPTTPAGSTGMITAATGTAHHWCVLKQTGGPGGDTWWKIDCVNQSGANYCVVEIAKTDFVTGTTAVGTAPTSATSRVLNTLDGRFRMIADVATAQKLHFVASPDGSWMIFNSTNGGGRITGGLVNWEIIPASVNDTNNQWIAYFESITNWQFTANCPSWSYWSGAWNQMYPTNEARFSAIPVGAVAGQNLDPDGLVQLRPATLCVNSTGQPRGRKGVLRDIFDGFCMGPTYGAPSSGDMELLNLATAAGTAPAIWVPFPAGIPTIL